MLCRQTSPCTKTAEVQKWRLKGHCCLRTKERLVKVASKKLDTSANPTRIRDRCRHRPLSSTHSGQWLWLSWDASDFFPYLAEGSCIIYVKLFFWLPQIFTGTGCIPTAAYMVHRSGSISLGGHFFFGLVLLVFKNMQYFINSLRIPYMYTMYFDHNNPDSAPPTPPKSILPSHTHTPNLCLLFLLFLYNPWSLIYASPTLICMKTSPGVWFTY